MTLADWEDIWFRDMPPKAREQLIEVFLGYVGEDDIKKYEPQSLEWQYYSGKNKVRAELRSIIKGDKND